jgi:hypothetical protein
VDTGAAGAGAGIGRSRPKPVGSAPRLVRRFFVMIAYRSRNDIARDALRITGRASEQSADSFVNRR